MANSLRNYSPLNKCRNDVQQPTAWTPSLRYAVSPQFAFELQIEKGILKLFDAELANSCDN